MRIFSVIFEHVSAMFTWNENVFKVINFLTLVIINEQVQRTLCENIIFS